MIYLDHAASTPLLPECLSVLEKSFREDFANPSSKHSLGLGVLHKVETARKIITEHFLGHFDQNKEFEFVFTSGATESNNIFLQGLDAVSSVQYFKGDHPSLIAPLDLRFKIKKSVFPYSFFKEEEASDLLAISLINGQSGEIVNLENLESFKKDHPRSIIFLDASQAFGKWPRTLAFFKNEGKYIDALSVSAHKMGGPKGIGALLYRKRLKINPLYVGGGQEKNIRPGTICAPLIVAWASAVTQREKDLGRYHEMIKLNHYLRESLKKEFLDQIIFPFEGVSFSPFILTFVLPPFSSDIIIRHLEEKEIYLSSTSACSAKKEGKNDLFLALGIEEKYHKNVLRVSFNYETTLAEIDLFTQSLSDIYRHLTELFGMKGR